MEDLIKLVNSLKASGIKKHISARLHEFKCINTQSNEGLFKELCFCLLTANFVAERAIKMQKEIGDGFLTLPEAELKGRLKGHRFANKRAEYIVKARQHKEVLKGLLASKSEHEAREWLVKNVSGLGMKEASHFLRNAGSTDVAIIDFHIISILVKYGVLIEPPKSLTRKRYLEIEGVLRKLAKKTGTNLAELDLYLWFAETGKILK